jgi:hypothetical protein
VKERRHAVGTEAGALRPCDPLAKRDHDPHAGWNRRFRISKPCEVERERVNLRGKWPHSRVDRRASPVRALIQHVPSDVI